MSASRAEMQLVKHGQRLGSTADFGNDEIFCGLPYRSTHRAGKMTEQLLSAVVQLDLMSVKDGGRNSSSLWSRATAQLEELPVFSSR